MNKEKKNLEQIKVVDIKGEKFTLDMTKLTVSNYLAIEAEKQRLSGGKYFNFATTYLQNSHNAADLIDMIAIFRVLEPKIEEGLSTKNFETLSIFDIKELLIIFKKEVVKWYFEWMKLFNDPFEESD